jgi:hypothetical protein
MSTTAVHNLLFQNPVFHKGLNVTCRRGDKWFKRVEDGTTRVQVAVTDGPIVGPATIVAHKQVDWGSNEDVQQLIGWLVFEHDPACLTVEGIRTEMQRVYGDDWDKEVMTVLFFVPDE